MLEQPELNDYLYWSPRMTNEAMQSFRIRQRRRSWSASLGLSGPQASVGTTGDLLLRAEIEERLLRKSHLRADLTCGTPSALGYVKACGRVEMGQFVGWPDAKESAYLHTRIDDGTGPVIDVVLFGSMSNYTAWRSGVQELKGGWFSSGAPDIVRLLDAGARRRWKRAGLPDDQHLAVEALTIVREQGKSLHDAAHRGLPASRDYTLGHASPARWCARIYRDVTLDPDRWLHLEELDSPSRILIGAALWARADPAGLTAYTAEVRASARALAQEREKAIEARLVGPGQETGYPLGEPPVLEPDPQPVRHTKQ